MATTTISLPAIVTITNTTTTETGRSIGFMPYRENFTAYIEPEDVLQVECSTAGQVLYYLGQATDELTVTQAAKE